MAAERELVDRCALPAQVEDPDLKGKEFSFALVLAIERKVDFVPLGRGHHGCSGTWDTACSCSICSNELDDDPFSKPNKVSLSQHLILISSELFNPSISTHFNHQNIRLNDSTNTNRCQKMILERKSVLTESERRYGNGESGGWVLVGGSL